MVTIFRVKRDGRTICWLEKLTEKEEGNLTEGRENYFSTHSGGTRNRVRKSVSADTISFICEFVQAVNCVSKTGRCS